MFGPTTGDKVKLGDTNLWVEVEKDYTVYGDECKFGGGKSTRNSWKDLAPQAEIPPKAKCSETARVKLPIGQTTRCSISSSPTP